MTTSQKAALSLLISVIAFGAFTVLAFTGLFDLIEARFYNPSVSAAITREITGNAEAVEQFLEETRTNFYETLNVPAVRRSFLPNQSAEDIFERSRTYGLLSESIGGLQWVRFIDSGGSRIHYSTYSPDILRQDERSAAYGNYGEPGFPYETIAVNDQQAPKYTFDEQADRILFSFPFYDSYDVYRGTALFSLSVRAVSDRLIREGRLKASQDISIISNPPGFISGMPAAVEKALGPRVSAVWREGGPKTVRLVSPDSEITLFLISVRTSQGITLGRLARENLFAFPQTMKIILLASFFLTLYLTIFLFFNLRQDSVTIVQNRLKQLQISLIEQFYERKGDADWARWSRELEQRRDEINLQLKKGVKTAPGAESGDLDILISKSWDELISVMGSRRDNLDEEKIRAVLGRVLAALPEGVSVPAPGISESKKTGGAVSTAAGETEPVEEIETLEEVEALEDATDVEEAEPVEEIEAFEEVETLEDMADVEEAEPVEEIEALEEVEALEDVADVEEAEPVEEIETLEEVETLEEAENAEEAGPVEEIEALEEVETLEEAENAEEAGPVEEIETLEEVEALEDATDVEEAGPVEEIEALEEVETLEDVADVEEAVEEIETLATGSSGRPEYEGEIPVIDMAEMDTLSGLADEVVQSLNAGDEISELEELEELDEADDGEGPSADSAAPNHEPAIDLENLASEIEFDYNPESDASEDDGAIESDLEIVSPFSTMLSDFSFPINDNAGQGQKDDGAETLIPENDSGDELSLIENNIFSFSGGAEIETLESLPGAGSGEPEIIEEIPDDAGVIEEREGVHYISGDVLSPDAENKKPLDRDFKDLVDSIIKLKR